MRLNLVLALSAAAGIQVGSVAAQEAIPSYVLADVRAKCIDFTAIKRGSGRDDYRECRVSEFGEIAAVDGQTYYYALYCVIPNWADVANGSCGDNSFNANYYRTRGLAVFSTAPAANGVRVVFERLSEEVGIYVYNKPVVARTAEHTLLQLTIAYDGTGNGNASEYFVRQSDRWERIDSESWLSEMRSRLPEGRETRKGVWPDLRTLRAETGLYRDGDGNCCPTGGVAQIQLTYRDKRFFLQSITFAPDGHARGVHTTR